MKKAIFISIFLYSFSVLAQITVCDITTKKPIENVNIISDKGLGTITNEQGVFTLEYFDGFKFLNFSHLTYSLKKIKNNELWQDTIYLKPVIVNLNEVVLTNFNAKDTLVKAITRIPVNYAFKKPFNLHGFYRESILEDSIGVAMTEVSFMTYHEKVKSDQIHEAKIIHGRRSENYTVFGLDLVGGIFNIIQKGDMVRQKINVFDLNNHAKYNFRYAGSIKDAKKLVYIIDYYPSNENVYNNRSGKLFIESKTLAITQITTKRDEEKLKKISENIDPKILKSKKAVYTLKDVNGIIKYEKNIDNKYYLSHINVTNKRTGLLRNNHHDYELSFKLIITRVNTTNSLKVNTNYNITKGFNKQVKKIPQMEYWNENNTLLFSEKEQKILNDIKNASN